jgi:arylsulfatase A-like enzyme
MAGQAAAQQRAQRPNIVVIMGDDIGIWNIGAYSRGMMAGRTPNLDKLANEGMLFTDYYAEASCTAGRANFITGELPIRTGMTTVGQAGSPIGIPAEAVTIATALKGMGYATGQFGKNHLGDLNEFLPTASTNSSATSTTSTRWKTRRTRTIRRTCWTRLARATWCTAGPRTPMTRR